MLNTRNEKYDFVKSNFFTITVMLHIRSDAHMEVGKMF